MNKIDVQIDSALADKFNSGDTAGLKAGGVFSFEHIRDGEVIASGVSPNIVVDEGLTYILDVALSAGAAQAAFYLGIYSNNYTPLSTDTAATFVASAGEITASYDEAARPTWIEPGVAAKALTNTASPAVFTSNATVSAYGAFLTSDSTKGATSGTLIAASKFSAVRALLATDTLNVTYTLTIADA